jgi:ribonuclease E
VAHHEGEAGNGGIEPEAGRGAERDVFHEDRPAAAAPETVPEPARSEEQRYTPPEQERAPERSWQAPADRYPSEPEAPRRSEAAPVAESPAPKEPEPVHAQPVAEPVHEDPSRPVRKGWWQRKFSGE